MFKQSTNITSYNQKIVFNNFNLNILSLLLGDMKECTEKITRLSPFEEAIGVLHKLQEIDGYCVANIGPVCVSLPEDMASKLKGLEGQKIGILRTDIDYRFRICDKRPS